MAEESVEQELPTPEEVAFFIEDAWKHAHDVTVEFVRQDSLGVINAWTTWKVDLPDGGGEDNLAQIVRFRQYPDGRIGMI